MILGIALTTGSKRNYSRKQCTGSIINIQHNMIQHSSSQGTVKADIVLKMAVVLLIYFWIPKKHFAKIAISMLSIRTFVPRWNCYPGLNITNASIFLSSVGASSDVSHLHHPMHPHLSQDPLTGQTILLGPMSTLVHTDQICKYPRCFSTVICLNYLRERGNLGKESISAPLTCWAHL